MSGVIACDISEFQPVVDDSYRHRWLTFRVCDGDYMDAHAAHNLAWAVRAKRDGRLAGFGVYVVYRPGKERASLGILDHLHVPTDSVVMIDAESWGGQIRGDHSTQLNTFAASLRHRQMGDPGLVWAYGNRGPDLTVWPRKAAWLGWVVASYGGTRPDEPNLAGWQYTDGTYQVPGLPSASAPFGPCDHNLIYRIPEDAMSAADVAAINKHTDEQIAGLKTEMEHIAEGLAKAISAVIHGDPKHPNSLDAIATELHTLEQKAAPTA